MRNMRNLRNFRVLIIAIVTAIPTLMYATRSPFDGAVETLYSEATDFFEGRNYLASIRYYSDFLKYKPSNVTPDDERVRIAERNIALAAYILRQDNAYTLLESYKQKYPYTENAEQIELYLGILDFERGKYKPALRRLEKVKSENLEGEEFNQLLFYRGYCYVQQGKYDKASFELSGLLKQRDNKYTMPAHYYYGYSQFYQENYKTALTHLSMVQNENDFKNSTPYLICECHYHLGDCDKAVAMGEELIKSNPKGKYVLNLRHSIASCQFKNKHYAEALENLTEYKKGKGKLQREDFYMMGICYFKQENAKEAINNLTKVTKPNDKLSQNSYFHIAMAYLSLGDKKQARMAFESASRFEFDKEISCDALYNYALITYELSYAPFNESVSAFERFLNDYPESPYCGKVYEYLTNVYLTTKNYQAAYESIQKIERKTPAVLEAEERVLFGMGTTQIANRKYGQAAESFRKIVNGKSCNPDLAARARFWYGECLYRQGKYPDAITSFREYLSKTTTNTEEEYAYAHYNLGYSYMKSGNRSESTTWFRKFTMLENTDKQMLADVYNRIGDNYFTERKFAEAKSAYTKAGAVADKVAGADYALYQTGLIEGLQKDYATKIETLNTLLTKYPASSWADDALFEKGKSYVAIGENDKAIETFKAIAAKYDKNNPIVRQSKLQIAMLYYNSGAIDSAVDMYKEVAVKYPGTEESQTSLESLENILVESNRVSEYTALAKTLDGKKGVSINIREDSLTYKAAEKSYFRDEFAAAVESFSTYLDKYPGGKYSSLATYYRANCYYRLGERAEALAAYQTLASDPSNPNRELTYQRLLELSYERQAYTATVTAATEVLSKATDAELIADAKYKRMKSNIALGNSALDDINDLRQDTRTAYGAEAEYYYIQYIYDRNDYEAAEKEIFSFIEKGTPHSYWLAKAFLVLADSYIARENYFDARQYLLSLQENYTPAPDDITDAINLRLNIINMKEESTTPVILSDSEESNF